jgi:UDP-N-acetylglucosamine acyltransferase
MATRIHPTAVVEDGAELGVDVEVGALAYVGRGVRLGDGTRLHHHAAVEGNTELGPGCEVFPFANLGAKTQDLKFAGGNPGVRIGARNVFREYVTVHAATAPDGLTTIGDNNVFLAHGHIVASNNTGIAGHVVVEDYVTFGAVSGVHQFCRIGQHAMISAYAKIVQDVAPYVIADGQPAVVRAINKVGLERRGFTVEQLDRVKLIFRLLFRDGLNRSQALEKLRTHPQAATPEFQAVLTFSETSERGLAPGAS